MIKGKILVVEDDEGMRIFVASALKKRGYTVTTGES
jgi:DNA-binding response OmpR family regulator